MINLQQQFLKITYNNSPEKLRHYSTYQPTFSSSSQEKVLQLWTSTQSHGYRRVVQKKKKKMAKGIK